MLSPALNLNMSNNLTNYWLSMSPESRAKTLKALEASIEHWKRHETGKAKDWELIYDTDCALCHRFRKLKSVTMDECAGCPISTHTGQSGCLESPWTETDYYFRGINAQMGKPQTKRFLKAASRMRAFLESLRPEGENKQTK